MSVELLHGDCMAYMAALPDKAFDLAIVDPPYGIGASSGAGRSGRLKFEAGDKRWDDKPPSPEYFAELFRVSKEQVIWGGNYFTLRPSRGFVVWDKGETMYGRDFSECEQAWVSRDCCARIFKFSPTQPDRFHPTQKPVALYRWLLHHYAKPGWRILDTHLGSGSSAIAAHEMGFDFVGIEIDADYIAAARKRFDMMTAQQRLEI